jgi:hypothetical protein
LDVLPPDYKVRLITLPAGESFTSSCYTGNAAVERLVGRGLLLRHRNGVRQDLSPSAFAVNALKVES